MSSYRGRMTEEDRSHTRYKLPKECLMPIIRHSRSRTILALSWCFKDATRERTPAGILCKPISWRSISLGKF